MAEERPPDQKIFTTRIALVRDYPRGLQFRKQKYFFLKKKNKKFQKPR